jgi:Icc-related predicted phosphoesterase
MKIAVCSDLHLEFKDIELFNTEGAEVLILSGDIMIADSLHNHAPPTVTSPYEPYKQLGHNALMAQRYRDFLKRVSFEFPHVVYVAGNHEFYHGKWKGSIDDLRYEAARFDNVYYLERDIKEINGYTFVGATLWTDCNKGDPLTLHALADMMNDFRIIRNDEHGYTKLRPAHAMYRHQQTVNYFKTVIGDRKDENIVVVGHHAPSLESIHERYRDPSQSLMNGGYASDLSEFILDHPQIKLWTHGHMHDPFDYNIGTTRIVCNPRGYGGHDPQADVFELKFLDI